MITQKNSSDLKVTSLNNELKEIVSMTYECSNVSRIKFAKYLLALDFSKL